VKERRQLEATKVIRLHKDRRLLLQQIGQSPNTNLRYAECMSLKTGK